MTTEQMLMKRHRTDASRLMYAAHYPTIVIAKLLDTTIKQIEKYLGDDRRVYRKP